MGFTVRVILSVRHEEPEEDMPMTLAGYSLWCGCGHDELEYGA